MKSKILFVIILCSSHLMIGQVNKGSVGKKQDERYRLHNKRKNFFDTEKDRIKLIIPVTEKSLKYGGVVNISSDSISAILVWIHGKDSATKRSSIRKKIRERRIKISSVLGLDAKRLEKEKSLVVAIFNNEICSYADIEQFRCLIKDSNSYSDAVSKLNINNNCKGIIKSNDCDVPGVKKPKEQGGDVIGEN